MTAVAAAVLPPMLTTKLALALALGLAGTGQPAANTVASSSSGANLCAAAEGGPWSQAAFASCSDRTRSSCVAGECCCRCSSSAYAYNPAPELMQWHGYNFSVSVVRGGKAAA
eukprot:SAG22_NODE_10125_length_551_cov_1.475664_1_plen_112_part_10